MPLLNIFTSGQPPVEGEGWLRHLSGLLARALNKDEGYVMVIVNPRPEMVFGGSAAPACYAELKNVGQLSSEQVEALSKQLCGELGRGLGVPTDRIYIEFTNADGALWGWDGATFG
jgi:phenylpyruvate tautomerase